MILSISAIFVSILAVWIHDRSASSGPVLTRVSKISFSLSATLGNASVLFSFPAVISIVGFYQDHAGILLSLTLLWILLICARPLETLHKVWGLFATGGTTNSSLLEVGDVLRIDDPNVIRVALTSSKSWAPDQIHTAALAGGITCRVLPLFIQTQDSQVIGTGYRCGDLDESDESEKPTSVGKVYSTCDQVGLQEILQRISGQNAPVEHVGIVVEDSTIGLLRIEVIASATMQEGDLLFVNCKGTSVYYQVLDAVTREESFDHNPHGAHIAIAGQLGTLDPVKGL
jgi:hypothetical protein